LIGATHPPRYTHHEPLSTEIESCDWSLRQAKSANAIPASFEKYFSTLSHLHQFAFPGIWREDPAEIEERYLE
jgi:hypothetical protein